MKLVELNYTPNKMVSSYALQKGSIEIKKLPDEFKCRKKREKNSTKPSKVTCKIKKRFLRRKANLGVLQ